ncbi:pirin family protein [Legionella sp. CNM-4043-24]|uniref:pirin family protein n=1 Tax=Legionella sp. CNM-4043-24 TaxID=3421646 RepID=UPI00403B082E
MIRIRAHDSRGHSLSHWLDSQHTFSFGEYHDPAHMGFSCLRVINEDIVQPGMGFGTHAHNNMEIISYVIDGSLEHKDSMGTGSIIRPGEIQRMSAGTGVRHSEYNHSSTENVHFLQIWIIPEQMGIPPGYQQEVIVREENKWILAASNKQLPGVITIHQNVQIYVAYLQAGKRLDYAFSDSRCGWLQMVKGQALLNGHLLSAGDGAAMVDEPMELLAQTDTECLLFDLPKPV